MMGCSGLGQQVDSALETDSSAWPDGWAFPKDRISSVFGREAMVSTTDRVATEMGAEILRRGGNAVDAAVAIQFALAVVNPEAGNIGGGGFMLIKMTNGPAYALDFREKAPLSAHRNMYLDMKGKLTNPSVVGHLAAGVPGSVAGMWAAHKRFGKLPWPELIQPAVNLAEGLVVHERLAQSLRKHAPQLQQYSGTASVLLPHGRPPRVGDRLIQRDLAETLRRIALEGKNGFYQGRTAHLIDSEMRRGGGLIGLEDLARYRAVWRKPLTFQYRSYDVITMPPPSSGGAAMAEILNILEGYDLKALGYHSSAHVHYWTEAVKRGFADRNAYLADPDFVSLPTERMISDSYADIRRAEIGSDRPTPSDRVHPGLGLPVQSNLDHRANDRQHTTHYSVVDKKGNAVAVTTTLNTLYGNRVMVAGAGFLLNNEMDDFTSSPGKANYFGLIQGEANAIGPEKRMLSSMSPTLLLDRAGRLKLVTGTPGGPTIITTMAQIISNIVDFDMDAGSATAAPRLHHQHRPDVLRYERDGLSPMVLDNLQRMGYSVQAWPGYQGDTQSIISLPDQGLSGVADPRGGGSALNADDTRPVLR